MNETRIEIKGGKELYDALQQLPAKIERNVMRGAIRAGALVIQEEAKRLVPVKSGALRESIRVSVRAIRGKVFATIRAGSNKGKDAAFYAHFVEFGTAAHEERPQGAKSLFFAGVFSEVVKHPGATPKPFMRPALDAKAQSAIDAVADYVRERLPKEFSKQARLGD